MQNRHCSFEVYASKQFPYQGLCLSYSLLNSVVSYWPHLLTISSIPYPKSRTLLLQPVFKINRESNCSYICKRGNERIGAWLASDLPPLHMETKQLQLQFLFTLQTFAFCSLSARQ